MAYGYKIDYITTSRRNIVKGVKFPMGSSEGGYLSQSVDNQTILEGLIQGIKTQKGERVMYPDFGTTMRRRLFEPITDTTSRDIKQEISELISRYFPRVILSSLRVGSLAEPDPNGILIQLTVNFVDQPSVEEELNIIIQ